MSPAREHEIGLAMAKQPGRALDQTRSFISLIFYLIQPAKSQPNDVQFAHQLNENHQQQQQQQQAKLSLGLAYVRRHIVLPRDLSRTTG